jgi:hypothetical protein
MFEAFVRCGYVKRNQKMRVFCEWLTGLTERETEIFLCNLTWEKDEFFYFCYFQGCKLTQNVLDSVYRVCLESNPTLTCWFHETRLMGESSYNLFESRVVRWSKMSLIYTGRNLPADPKMFVSQLERNLKYVASSNCLKIAIRTGEHDVLKWALKFVDTPLIKETIIWTLKRKRFKNKLQVATLLCWSVSDHMEKEYELDNEICKLAIKSDYEPLLSVVVQRGFLL